MQEGVKAKFGTHSRLRDYLLATGRKTIIESSKHDTVYGIGMSLNVAAETNPDIPLRSNKLGKILMNVRQDLGMQHQQDSMIVWLIYTYIRFMLYVQVSIVHAWKGGGTSYNVNVNIYSIRWNLVW